MEGTLFRSIKLVEAYKVIGIITREIGQDFPNKVYLHQGRVNQIIPAEMEIRVRKTVQGLVQRIHMINDPDYLTEMALNLRNLDSITDDTMSILLKETIYAN